MTIPREPFFSLRKWPRKKVRHSTRTDVSVASRINSIGSNPFEKASEMTGAFCREGR